MGRAQVLASIDDAIKAADKTLSHVDDLVETGAAADKTGDMVKVGTAATAGGVAGYTLAGGGGGGESGGGRKPVATVSDDDPENVYQALRLVRRRLGGSVREAIAFCEAVSTIAALEPDEQEQLVQQAAAFSNG